VHAVEGLPPRRLRRRPRRRRRDCAPPPSATPLTHVADARACFLCRVVFFLVFSSTRALALLPAPADCAGDWISRRGCDVLVGGRLWILNARAWPPADPTTLIGGAPGGGGAVGGGSRPCVGRTVGVHCCAGTRGRHTAEAVVVVGAPGRRCRHPRGTAVAAPRRPTGDGAVGNDVLAGGRAVDRRAHCRRRTCLPRPGRVGLVAHAVALG